MSWSVFLSPLVPVWALWLGALVALAMVGVGLWSGRRSLWARAPFLLLLTTMLANPSLREEEREPIPDIVAVVLDESQSQSIGARQAQGEAALSALTERLEAAGDVEIRVARTGAEDTSPEAQASTRLFSALDRLTADVAPDRLAGAVLITDGQVHDVPADPAARPTGTAPVHALLTGRNDLGDRKLTVETAPVFGLVGQLAGVKLRIDDLGTQGPSGMARLTVRLNGEAIAQRGAPVGRSLDIPVRIPHAGRNVLEIEVEPGPEELTLANNRVALSINGVRDRLKVLLVSGEPHAGQRTWRNLLKSDPAVELVHFTILRPEDKQDFTQPDELALIAFPTDELFNQKLYDFDLVIFDRFRQRGVLHMAYLGNVARYVEQGGALLTAAGPAFATRLSLYETPLSAVFPAAPTGQVIERSFRPGVTALGARHPVTAGLPGAQGPSGEGPGWGPWYRLIEARALSGQTLMTGADGHPILVLDRFGEGRVAQLLSDHLWLWARGHEGGGPQQELLRRLAHWLMREPELEEEDLSAEARGRRLEISRRTMADSAPPVTVTAPSGASQTVELEEQAPGVWSRSIDTDEIGLYRLESGPLAAVAAMGPLDGEEFADVRPTASRLAPLGRATGGGQYWLAPRGGTAVSLPTIRRVRAGRETTGSTWLGLVDNQRYEVRSTRDMALVPPLVWALLLLGSLLAAWRYEAR